MTKRLATILSQISAATTATSTLSSAKSPKPARAMTPRLADPRPEAEATSAAERNREATLSGEPQRFTDGVGDPDCPFCHGLGYLREEVQPGHPNFGRLQPCVCQIDN